MKNKILSNNIEKYFKEKEYYGHSFYEYKNGSIRFQLFEDGSGECEIKNIYFNDDGVQSDRINNMKQVVKNHKKEIKLLEKLIEVMQKYDTYDKITACTIS